MRKVVRSREWLEKHAAKVKPLRAEIARLKGRLRIRDEQIRRLTQSLKDMTYAVETRNREVSYLRNRLRSLAGE